MPFALIAWLGLATVLPGAQAAPVNPPTTATKATSAVPATAAKPAAAKPATAASSGATTKPSTAKPPATTATSGAKAVPAPPSDAKPAVSTPPAAKPAAARLAAPVEFSFRTADSVTIAARWYAGPAGASSVLLAPRVRGEDSALAGSAVEFQRHGFNAMTLVLRDAPVADREKDTLRYVVLASRWADDVAGGLRAARVRTEPAARVYGWGQGMGAALLVCAVPRAFDACEGIAAEQLYRFVEEVMRENGTSVIAEAQARQSEMLQPRDEPLSAAARLTLPVYAVLTGANAGTSEDITQEVLRRNRGRTDRWRRPWITEMGRAPGASDVDTLAVWFNNLSRIPRAR